MMGGGPDPCGNREGSSGMGPTCNPVVGGPRACPEQTHSQRCDRPGKGQERFEGKRLKPEAQQQARVFAGWDTARK